MISSYLMTLNVTYLLMTLKFRPPTWDSPPNSRLINPQVFLSMECLIGILNLKHQNQVLISFLLQTCSSSSCLISVNGNSILSLLLAPDPGVLLNSFSSISLSASKSSNYIQILTASDQPNSSHYLFSPGKWLWSLN